MVQLPMLKLGERRDLSYTNKYTQVSAVLLLHRMSFHLLRCNQPNHIDEKDE